MSTFVNTVEDNSRMIDLGKPAAVISSQFHSAIFQGQDQALEISHNSLEKDCFDLFVAAPVMVVTHGGVLKT